MNAFHGCFFPRLTAFFILIRPVIPFCCIHPQRAGKPSCGLCRNFGFRLPGLSYSDCFSSSERGSGNAGRNRKPDAAFKILLLEFSLVLCHNSLWIPHEFSTAVSPAGQGLKRRPPGVFRVCSQIAQGLLLLLFIIYHHCQWTGRRNDVFRRKDEKR